MAPPLDPLTEHVYPAGGGYDATTGVQRNLNTFYQPDGPIHGVSEAPNEWADGLVVRDNRVPIGQVPPQVLRPGYGGGPNAPVGPFSGRTTKSLHYHDTNSQILNFDGGAHIIVQYLRPSSGAQNPQIQSASTSPNRPAPPFGQVVIGPFAQHPGYH